MTPHPPTGALSDRATRGQRTPLHHVRNQMPIVTEPSRHDRAATIHFRGQPRLARGLTFSRSPCNKHEAHPSRSQPRSQTNGTTSTRAHTARLDHATVTQRNAIVDENEPRIETCGSVSVS